MKKHVVLFGLLAFCFTITAQEKITVVKIDTKKDYEKLFRNYYEIESDELIETGYNGAALFVKLFKQYFDNNKVSIDDPKPLNDTIKKYRKIVSQVETLKKDNDKNKSYIKILNDSIKKMNNSLNAIKTEIANNKTSEVNAKKELLDVIKIHKTDSVSIVEKDKLLKDKDKVIADKDRKINDLQTALANQKTAVAENKQEIEKLKGEINTLFKSAVADFDDVYAKLGTDIFSVDNKTVMAAIAKAESVKGILPTEYSDKISKVKKVSELENLLGQAKTLMAGAYDEGSVNSLLQKEVVVKRESWFWTNQQKNQSDDIVSSLRNFSKYVGNFERMIDEVNQSLEKSGRKEPKNETERYQGMMRSRFAFVSNGNIENGYGKYFTHLNKQLTALWDKISNDGPNYNKPNVPKEELRTLKSSVRKIV